MPAMPGMLMKGGEGRQALRRDKQIRPTFGPDTMVSGVPCRPQWPTQNALSEMIEFFRYIRGAQPRSPNAGTQFKSILRPPITLAHRLNSVS